LKIRQKVLILLFGLFLLSCGNQPLNSAAWQNPQIPKDEWIANGTTCEEYINFFNSVREREYLMVENDPRSVGYALEADESLIDTTFLMKGFADYEINGEISDRTSECLDFLTPEGFEFFEYKSNVPLDVEKSWPISIKWFTEEDYVANPNPNQITGYAAYLNIHPKSKGCSNNVFAALEFLAIDQYGETIPGRKTTTQEVSGPLAPGTNVVIRFDTFFDAEAGTLEYISCYENWGKEFYD
jgi:hypothetical protein